MEKRINYSDGYYQGEVSDTNPNVRNGHGCYYSNRGESFYGYWVNDKMEGAATVSFPNGNHRVNHYHDNKLHGTCTLYDKNNNMIVEDEYENGTMVQRSWPDGTWGRGSFDQDYLMHGEGELYVPEEKALYKGNFVHNELNGVFKVSYDDGSEEYREYEFGKMVKVISQTSAKKEETVEVDVKPLTNEDVDKTRYLYVEENKNEKYAEELKPYFQGLIGMTAVKDQLDKIYKRFRIDSIRQQMLDIGAQKQGYYFIITGNPGTGKTTVARIIGRMLKDTGILKNDTFVEVDRSGLVGEYIGQTEKKTAEVIESARGGTLFIDEAYTLYRKDNERDFGREAIEVLLKDMEDHRGEYCVILAGYQDQMTDMIRNANAGLASRFDHKISIPDYSTEEITNILINMALAKHFFIEKAAAEVIRARIEKEKVDDTFDNARFARRLLSEAIERQAVRLSENFADIELEDLQTLIASDFGQIEVSADTLEQTMDDLNKLIGLTGVKKEIASIVHSVKVMQESRKRNLAISGDAMNLNMVFTGNPGTGKTTVARLVGKIYYHLGLLKRPDVFVECTRAELVGRYQGDTAMKVKEVVRSALGGVLFIDEAYSLVNGSGDSFGLEAVNTLVSEIENNRDKLAVILAGYSREMSEFLDNNSGLRSRLNRVIEFEDYTVAEMQEIFCYQMTKRGYKLDISEDRLKQLLAKRSQARDFGNARGVRNICDEVVLAHNNRINNLDLSQLSNDSIVTITDEDLDI